MNILIISTGLILWYIAYEAKPKINDGINYLWEEKNTIKRNKLIGILKQSN